MAGELKHIDVTAGKITENQYEAVTQHELESGVEGDFIYWDDTNECFKRIAHKDDFGLHTKVVPKTADETVNNSTTLQNDDELLFAVAANEVWQIWIYLIVMSGTTPDIKVGVAVPGGTVLTWKSTKLPMPNSDSQTGTFTEGAVGLAYKGIMVLHGILEVGGTSGNFQLTWAQQTQDASDTIVKANSCLIATQLA